MFFDGWWGILRTVVSGLAGYVGLVLLLRISGKRTLTKLNAFDLVVTVALGSCLATLLLSRDTPIVDGLVAFAVLIGLQWVVAFTGQRSATFRRLIKSQPALVFHRGEFLEDALRRERLTPEEVRAVIREQGFASLDEVAAVVLKTGGELSVLEEGGRGRRSSLHGVRDAESGLHA